MVTAFHMAVSTSEIPSTFADELPTEFNPSLLTANTLDSTPIGTEDSMSSTTTPPGKQSPVSLSTMPSTSDVSINATERIATATKITSNDPMTSKSQRTTIPHTTQTAKSNVTSAIYSTTMIDFLTSGTYFNHEIAEIGK